MPQEKRRTLNRRQGRDLDVEIGFLEGLARRDPGYADALELLGDDYIKRGRVADGLKVDEQLRSLRPEDPRVRYNLACSLALNGEFERAVAELESALELGFRDFHWLTRDPELAALRKLPGFSPDSSQAPCPQGAEGLRTAGACCGTPDSGVSTAGWVGLGCRDG
jgi:tetratricopeptide (TPR) repeat protein